MALGVHQGSQNLDKTLPRALLLIPPYIPLPSSVFQNMTTAVRGLRACVLNAGKLDFDHALSFASLSQICEVTRHEVTEASNPASILERVQDHDVVVTKEMELSKGVIEQFPPSVKLICEAGTGFNNIACEAAGLRGIPVCNVPAYSTDAVAQLVITYV